MSVLQIVPGVTQVSLGMVNVFLLVGENVTVIDTGMPGSAPKILDALAEIGKRPRDIGQILITHLHADHTGSAKALKEAAAADGGAAKIYMHASDAEAFEQGQVMRKAQPAPGLLNTLIFKLLSGRAGPSQVEPAAVDCTISDGEELPFAGGLKAFHVPGHTAGNMVFLWPQQGGVLFSGDTCGRMSGPLGFPVLFEDMSLGLQSLRRVAGMQFEYAVFGHGKPILGGAAQQFRKKFG